MTKIIGEFEASLKKFPSQTASYISDSVQEPGIDGLARTNLRFS
jgi:hypothetical protein